jgi:hypothetical protein
MLRLWKRSRDGGAEFIVRRRTGGHLAQWKRRSTDAATHQLLLSELHKTEHKEAAGQAAFSYRECSSAFQNTVHNRNRTSPSRGFNSWFVFGRSQIRISDRILETEILYFSYSFQKMPGQWPRKFITLSEERSSSNGPFQVQRAYRPTVRVTLQLMVGR